MEAHVCDFDLWSDGDIDVHALVHIHLGGWQRFILVCLIRPAMQTSRAVESWDATVIEALEAYAVARFVRREQVELDWGAGSIRLRWISRERL